MTVLELSDASFAYGSHQILHEVSLALGEGESVGLVGESGSGKSTMLSLLLGLNSPQTGEVRFEGQRLERRNREQMRAFRTAVQAVFQDPASSLNPRQRVGRIVGEPLRSLGLATGADAGQRVREALTSVGLPADAALRYPHEFSGGQQQRIAIARATVSSPRVLLADEPVSALDVTTRIHIIDLLAELRESQGLALLMVSHDLGSVAALCERTVVLRDGRVVEEGTTRELLRAPQSEYAQELIAAVPRLPAGGQQQAR
ncbi:MAG: ABC transporter ATP-binding protein [Microbacteriaceae bacterium]